MEYREFILKLFERAHQILDERMASGKDVLSFDVIPYLLYTEFKEDAKQFFFLPHLLDQLYDIQKDGKLTPNKSVIRSVTAHNNKKTLLLYFKRIQSRSNCHS